MVSALLLVLPAVPADAATNTLKLHVSSARSEPHAPGGTVAKGDPITEYRFLINEDATGTTAQRTPEQGAGCSAQDANYPTSCRWPSIDEPSGWAPIVTQGDQTDLNGTEGLNLPNGRYLISVLADGYKIDGAHFTVPLDGTGVVDVGMQPNPLPDTTVRGQVFADNAPTNQGLDVGEAGLDKFVGHLKDYIGEVQTDVYGNPLCTTYVGENPVTHEIPWSADGPEVAAVGGECKSDADGLLTIPHIGPGRYSLSATPPDGTGWIQTTTLEGNHDWDAWQIEGDTGFDATFVVGGEQTPLPIFGFVKPHSSLNGGASGHVKGSVVGIKTYTPPKGGSFDFWGGNTGTKAGNPIKRPWLSLNDLEDGDQAVWTGQGDANGSFDIAGVPDGNYTLAWWDEPQDYNLNFINVTVQNGQTVQMGRLPLNGWWTEYEGFVFNDTNRNGVKDNGEPGIPNFTLTLRRRENSLMDRGQNTTTTDSTGHYYFESGYPTGEWYVMEAYSDSYYTTGITYKTDNQPNPTTVKGSGVDISALPIIGLSGTVDWGVHGYSAGGTNTTDPRNGGIVGTVSYDTTRNELDPQYAATEDWQPGISGVPMKLYAPVDCGTTDAPCDEDELYELAPDGSYAKGTLLNEGTTESWERPTGCTARDVAGNPLVHKADNPTNFDENVLVPTQEGNGECISSFMQGVQFAPYPTAPGSPDANFGAAVNGNYGFGEGCYDGTLETGAGGDPVCTGGSFEPLTAGDYLVVADLPDDTFGKPMYKATGEEDINIGRGDQIVPQVPPPACAGALHTIDVEGDGTDEYPELVGDGTNGAPGGVTVPASVPVHNPTFLDIGGSPYEGSPRASCDTKLVTLNNGKSVAPIFNVFTDVPVPARFRTVIIDDINFSSDPRSIMYGEKQGLAFAPVGLYDYNNRLVYTTETDFNGIYDVLMPSTDTINCPTPSGVCAGMYRMVANDPGIPGRLNPNYNPRYRTHAAGVEALPGLSTFADLAPTQVGLTVESPSTGLSQAVTCPLTPTTPQLFTVDQPFVNGYGSFAIEGTGFGAAKGTGQVALDGVNVATTAWSNTHIGVSVPAGTPVGPHQLTVTNNDGRTTVNGLTFHVLGTGYDPAVRQVGPGKTYATIQAALDAAFANNGNATTSADDLVVVYPGTPSTNNPRLNPRGAYYENLIMASPVKLQGVGPGGFQGNTYVPGSIIDASAFGGDTASATAWFNKIAGFTWDGNQDINDAEGIYVIASANATTAAGRARQFTAGFKASVDGFDLRGGEQNGFPGNVNDLTGGSTGLPPTITTQGGAIFANAYARHLQITNNVVQNNGSGYGTIRIGTPDLPAPDTNQHNENVRIAHNRIIQNAGTNLAGGVGIFAGSDNYEVSSNDICGNFSLEYGGGLSVYGRSPNGKIHHNRIYLNMSNDEGGGIMIAGQLPADPSQLSPGTGPVDITANQIQGNLSNDDGGGLRFLMAGGQGGTDQMNVVNNMIVNNVSTHEGGGISLNDAPNVRVVNNTIMKNLTTATAVTSDGTPAPAGLSTSAQSDQLQATLGAGAPTFSKPVLFNNVFWDNRAGTRAGTTSTGLGLPGDGTPVDHWDVGAQDGSGTLSPTSSVVQQNAAEHAYGTDPSNSTTNPGVVSTYDVSVSFNTWRQNPGFVDASLVTVEAPPDQLGDYHLADCPASPACNLGAAATGGVNAPTTDIDDQLRPALGGYDSGADEFGAGVAPPPPPPPTGSNLYFSTEGNTNPPGVTGTADDSDMYRWDGSAFSRVWDASAHSVLGIYNVDGFSRVDDTHFYVSFTGLTLLPGAGLTADEDVLYYNDGTWSLWFDGSAHGVGGSIDLGATSVVGNTLYFSTNNNAVPPGAGSASSGDNADVYRWNGGNSFTRMVDASAAPFSLPDTGSATGSTNPNVDGLIYVDSTHFYVSFSNTSTTVPGLGTVQDEDVLFFDGDHWTTHFDGTAAGLTATAQDLDAIAFSSGALPPVAEPPPPPAASDEVWFSTAGNTNPPGVTGTADDSDVYRWSGTAHSRAVDLSTHGVPASANVDGFSRVDDNHFYVSFSGTTTAVTGLGTVQDEDVLYYNAGAWSVWFDGTANGLTNANEDIDALTVIGNDLYFSTLGNTNPPGVAGTADDADVYLRRGSTYSRVWDASSYGLLGAANVDGLDWVDGSHFALSFSPTLTFVPSLGIVDDEDVVQYDAGTWRTYFDGGSHGLNTSGNLDIDALDLP